MEVYYPVEFWTYLTTWSKSWNDLIKGNTTFIIFEFGPLWIVCYNVDSFLVYGYFSTVDDQIGLYQRVG